MHPILVEWGSFIVPAWHAFVALGAVAAFFLFKYLVGKDIAPEHSARLFVICYLFGLLGARITNILVAPESYDSLLGFLRLAFSVGGMVFYGGFLGGFLAGLLYALKVKLPIRKLADAGIVAVFLGLVLGRIGCFLNGDDYGKPGPAESVFTVIFPNLGDNTPRYPTQLFEASGAAVLVALGIFSLKRKNLFKRSGQLAICLACGYAVLRFILEFLRGDERGFLVANLLSVSQFLSLMVIAIGVFATAVLAKRES